MALLPYIRLNTIQSFPEIWDPAFVAGTSGTQDRALRHPPGPADPAQQGSANEVGPGHHDTGGLCAPGKAACPARRVPPRQQGGAGQASEGLLVSVGPFAT